MSATAAEDPIAQLIADVMAQMTNSASRKAYEADLGDFTTTFLESVKPVSSPRDAVEFLIGGSFDNAAILVQHYRETMLDVQTERMKDLGQQPRELSVTVVNRRLTVLRKIVKAANRRAMIPWVLDIKNLKEEEVHVPGPGKAGLIAILSTAAQDSSPRGRRAYAVLRLMADLGLRRGSIGALDFSDLRLGTGEIGARLKGYAKRKWKGLPESCIVALKRWLEVHPGKSRSHGPVFINLVPGKYTRLSGSAIYELVEEYSERAGFRTRPHGIRHTAITTAITNAEGLGETLDSVREFSDHQDIRTMVRYRDSGKGVQRKFADANAQAFGDPFSK